MSLNPEIFQWARSTAGLTPEQAAHALRFNNTRDRSAADRLKALESGDEQPSRSVLLRMAKAYRRSLLVFYLSEPPKTGDRGQDFRTLPGAPPPLFNPFLDALIRDIRGRQTIVRDLLEDAEQQAVNFIGSASMQESAESLAGQIVKRIGFSLTEFRSEPSIEKSFGYLREKIEATGVYVLLLGNLGSHHTNIPVETFRGFAISDEIAPFVVINDQDAHVAWSFTALHELAHLWLGTTGVSGGGADNRIERYCNDVAAEVLLPLAEVHRLTHLRSARFTPLVDALSAFANIQKISRPMVAYSLLRANIITDAKWRQLQEHFRQEWIASRNRQPELDERDAGGPSYYVVKRHRLGNALLDLVRRSLTEGSITPTKAGQVLGVKPRNVEPLVNGLPAQAQG